MLAEQPTLYRACTIDGCEKPHKAKDYCDMHYRRWLKHGDPSVVMFDYTPNRPGTCTIDGCEKPSAARGWCPKHYQRWRAHGDPSVVMFDYTPNRPDTCTIDGCEKPHAARGWCNTHYARWRAHGDPNTVLFVHVRGRPETCTADGCDQPHIARGWCRMHYARWKRANPFEACTFAGCDNGQHAKGWCIKHYDRHRRHGDPNAVATSSPPRDVPTVVYLVAHPHLNALKIGIHWPEATYDRIAEHEGYGWQPVEQWTLSDRDGAEALERAVLDWWRGQGWPDAVFPEDMPQGGWTETVSAHHVAASDVVAFVDRRLTEKISDLNGSACTASPMTKEVHTDAT